MLRHYTLYMYTCIYNIIKKKKTLCVYSSRLTLSIATVTCALIYSVHTCTYTTCTHAQHTCGTREKHICTYDSYYKLKINLIFLKKYEIKKNIKY